MIKMYFFFVSLFLLLASCGINKSLKDKPDVSNYNGIIPERIKTSDSTYYIGDNFLNKNEHGLWELYVEGDPLERGLAIGSLTQELLQRQERVFLNKVNDLVPSKTRQSLLRGFLKWYNRKMYQHITNEFKAEIYGVSNYSSDAFKILRHLIYVRCIYIVHMISDTHYKI